MVRNGRYRVKTVHLRQLWCPLFLLCLLLASCAGDHPGQAYPDVPSSSILADDGVLATGNYRGTLSQPYTVGFDMLNVGSYPITLEAFTFVDAPPNVTVFAVALSRPLENDKLLIEAGAIGYPPISPRTNKPYIFHSLKGAIVHPNEYVEAIISLKSSKRGAFLVKGFLLTLMIGRATYQHYYPTTVVLCINVSHDICAQAFKQAGQR